VLSRIKRLPSSLRRRLVRPATARSRLIADADNTHDWLCAAFTSVMRNEVCARKPQYVWGLLQGAILARVLGITCISALELGVAGGYGLLALEQTAMEVEQLVGLAITVLGFDTGVGLPKPRDFRDQPYKWVEGQLPMEREKVEGLLRRASLRIGPVSETIPAYVEEGPAPIGFVSFDLDLYSSTRDSLALFEAGSQFLLPRIPCYFDDIIGHTYNDFAGERLAIHEFNDDHEYRKLSPVYALRHYVPPRYADDRRWEGMYFAHFFDHPLYDSPDSRRVVMHVDENGRTVREPVPQLEPARPAR
jgi:hypothetical protein